MSRTCMQHERSRRPLVVGNLVLGNLLVLGPAAAGTRGVPNVLI